MTPLERRAPLARRKQLKRGSQLKRGTGLRRTPFRRRPPASAHELDAAKAAVRARSGGVCEAWHVVTAACFEAKVQEIDGLLRLVMMTDEFADALRAFAEDSGCTERAMHVHHRKFRGRGGTHSLDNLVDICAPAHDWIHAHSRDANLLGLALLASEPEERLSRSVAVASS